MKRYALWASVLFTLAMVSCVKETTEVPASEELTFSAVWADSPGTRTALQENGTSIWWTTGEEINVFLGTVSSGKFTSTNTESQELVQFRGTLDAMTGTVETPNSEIAFWAVYPYDAANACDGESVTLTVPSAQVGAEGTFSDKFFPAVAASPNFALAFYNVCGGARFSVANTDIESVTFKANAGEPLVGKARIVFGEDGKPAVDSISEGSAEVTVTAPEGGFVPGKYYFAIFLPQTLAKGLTMTFHKEEGNASYSNPNSITVKRSHFGKLDEKDKDLHFGTAVPEAIDLGLSVKWASFNLGAADPTEFGDYYAWGEKETYYESGYAQSAEPVWKDGKTSGYAWSSYAWSNGDSSLMTRYCTLEANGYEGFTDGLTVLEPEDDVASFLLGEKWRLPTRVELAELKDKCTWEWAPQDEVNGYKVTGPNGNSIFLPAAGYRYLTNLQGAGARGYYASSSLNASGPTYAHDLYFLASTATPNNILRHYGLTVRPVLGDRVIPVESVSLDKAELTISVGATASLTATVFPANASDKNVSWSSSDEAVVTVSDAGEITSHTAGSAVITVTTEDGSKTATCNVTAEVPFSLPVPDKVDLGLSVKWASFNLGATKPEEYGDYYAWGEISPYYEAGYGQFENPLWKAGKEAGYIWSSYRWCKGESNSLTKYCSLSDFGYDGFTDEKTVLEPIDDAAYMSLGGAWRIPTKEEIDELLENCDWEWITVNEVEGYKVMGPNGNSIFFPAAGYRYLADLQGAGTRGYYASSSLNTSGPAYARDLYFLSGTAIPNNLFRHYGLTVRPVAK